MLCRKEPSGMVAQQRLFSARGRRVGPALGLRSVATFGRNEATPLTYCCCSFRRSKSAISSGGNSCGASFRALKAAPAVLNIPPPTD